MRLPRLLLTLPLLLLSLTSCNGNGSLKGTYSFQLGSKFKTYAAIELSLTDDPFVTETGEDTKKFSLTFESNASNKYTDIFEILSGLDDIVIDENNPEPTGESETTSEESSSEGQKPVSITINGYYYTDDTKNKDGQVIHLGLNILDQVDINPSIIEKLIYSYISGSTITVVVPVSINDLLFQLYWYGYRAGSVIDLIEPVYFVDESPKVKEFLVDNNIGTHPSKEQIALIKEYQKERQETKPEGYVQTESTFVNYRDFYTIGIGLRKQ